MSQSEKSELEKNFKTLDKDGDGKLSVEELIEGLRFAYFINLKNIKGILKFMENLNEKKLLIYLKKSFLMWIKIIQDRSTLQSL